jgi:hypothetical protein
MQWQQYWNTGPANKSQYDSPCWSKCRAFHDVLRDYKKDPPTDKAIRAWYKQFTETGCLCKQKSSGRPLIAEDYVERVRASFLHSPKKSKGTAAKELSMLKTTVWRVLRRRLVFKQQCGGFCAGVSCLTFWHRNFILHTLYIKCKNTGPKKR